VKRLTEYCEILYYDDHMQDQTVSSELEEISPPPQEELENCVLKDEVINILWQTLSQKIKR